MWLKTATKTCYLANTPLMMWSLQTSALADSLPPDIEVKSTFYDIIVWDFYIFHFSLLFDNTLFFFSDFQMASTSVPSLHLTFRALTILHCVVTWKQHITHHLLYWNVKQRPDSIITWSMCWSQLSTTIIPNFSTVNATLFFLIYPPYKPLSSNLFSIGCLCRGIWRHTCLASQR